MDVCSRMGWFGFYEWLRGSSYKPVKKIVPNGDG